MYNVTRRKNYVLGQNAETAIMVDPNLDPANRAAESGGGFLQRFSGVGLFVAAGLAAGYLLGPKAHKMRNALIGGAAAFGVHYLMQGRTVAVPAPAPVEEELELEF